MYCYSFEQHEEEVDDIQTLTNKVISLLNLRIRINEKDTEIDENELKDIEVCVGMVCDGTDFEVEHIVKREGATVSFESDENVIVRFIKALMEHIRAMVKKLKDWKDSIFNRKKLLSAMLLKTEAQVTQDYKKSRTDADKIILTNGFKTFMLKDDVVTDSSQLIKYIQRTGSVIDFYLSEVDVNLLKATENIKSLLKEDGDTIVYVNRQKNKGDSPTTETVAVERAIKTIHEKLRSTKDGFSSKDSVRGYETNNSGIMLGNKTLTSTYAYPIQNSENNLTLAISEFSLRIRATELNIDKDYDEIEFDRWDKKECQNIILEVHTLKDKLESLSDIMKTSIERVEDFHKQAESLLKSVRTADKDHVQTAEKAKAQKTLLSLMKNFNTIYETVPAQLNEHILSQAFNVLNVIRRHASNVEKTKPNNS